MQMDRYSQCHRPVNTCRCVRVCERERVCVCVCVCTHTGVYSHLCRRALSAIHRSHMPSSNYPYSRTRCWERGWRGHEVTEGDGIEEGEGNRERQMKGGQGGTREAKSGGESNSRRKKRGGADGQSPLARTYYSTSTASRSCPAPPPTCLSRTLAPVSPYSHTPAIPALSHLRPLASLLFSEFVATPPRPPSSECVRGPPFWGS